ncbi:MAG: hypothetical protein O7J95_15725 [Planctomycetota bacterium]|nr:hypothetical protein [Planctomycetota bacterium]
MVSLERFGSPPHRIHFRLRFLGVFLMPFAVTAGCSMDELFGTGQGADAAVATPSGVQSGEVVVVFTLTHETRTDADITANFSTDGGATFVAATEAVGGGGTENLSVSADGVTHTFIWDSGKDAADGREDVVFRIAPRSGTSALTGSFVLHNRVFLAASHAATTGEVSLYELNLMDGEVRAQGTVASGGNSPWDVLFDRGVFYVTHTGSNEVAALELDEVQKALLPLADSPFSTGGIGSKYLATDGARLFVANTGSETISIFDVDTGTGALALSPHSGVSVSGCRSLVVRGSRLYTASETRAEIVIHDIQSDGELLLNGFSPIAALGMDTPRAMAIESGRLYVANSGAPTLVGFRFLGGGDLLAVSGSPFSFTDAGVEAIHVQGIDRLFLAGGAAASFTALTVDALGVASEDVGSPLAAQGPANGVSGAAGVVVIGTSTSMTLESYLIDTAGALTAATGSPFAANGEVARLAVSD